MPYVVTTNRPPQAPTRESQTVHGARTRRAVATLEDRVLPDESMEDGARTVAAKALDSLGVRGDDFNRAWIMILGLTESGGTVGPLPDGTVIEVRRAP